MTDADYRALRERDLRADEQHERASLEEDECRERAEPRDEPSASCDECGADMSTADGTFYWCPRCCAILDVQREERDER